MNTIPKKSFAQKWHVKAIIWTVIVLGLFIGSCAMTGVDVGTFVSGFNQFMQIFYEMLTPDWSYVPFTIQPIIQTIQMALIGTLIGSIVAVPFAVLAARNIVTNTLVRGVIRFILNLVRTLPDLMLAAIFVAVVGIGPMAGVLTLAIFSFGMISKLFYEAIETIDMGPIEALTAAGATKTQVVWFAVLPQVYNHFLSYFLYTFEINVRASTILGYLGAGGIGELLQRSLGQFRYDRTAIVVIGTFIVVVVVDTLSNQLRERLQ